MGGVAVLIASAPMLPNFQTSTCCHVEIFGSWLLGHLEIVGSAATESSVGLYFILLYLQMSPRDVI